MKKRLVQAIVLLAALGMIAFGITRGEMRSVGTKANTICLECIGIG